MKKSIEKRFINEVGTEYKFTRVITLFGMKIREHCFISNAYSYLKDEVIQNKLGFKL